MILQIVQVPLQLNSPMTSNVQLALKTKSLCDETQHIKTYYVAIVLNFIRISSFVIQVTLGQGINFLDIAVSNH
jgi:hypothetical protein